MTIFDKLFRRKPKKTVLAKIQLVKRQDRSGLTVDDSRVIPLHDGFDYTPIEVPDAPEKMELETLADWKGHGYGYDD